MDEQTLSSYPAIVSEDKREISHLLVFFALVYLVEGLGQTDGLISQPLYYYLKEVYGWTPVQVTAFITVFNLPWIVKPVYGFISDFVPLFGYRRKSYLVIANVAAIAGYCWKIRRIAGHKRNALRLGVRVLRGSFGHGDHIGLRCVASFSTCRTCAR